jgi:uncharacterized protein
MAQAIYVNLPVTDVERAVAFYEALGATRDPRFSVPATAAAMVFSEAITIMLLSHDHFRNFAPRPITDARATNEVLICLSRESRAAVDSTVERALAAGGRADLRPKQEMGACMYGRNVEDLDGHVIELMWLDAAAMMQAGADAAASAT